MERLEREDRRGQWMHVGIGAVSCAMVAGPTTIVEFAIVPVGVFWLIRWAWMWRVARWSFLEPLFFAGVLVVAWQTLSLAWSADRHVGVEQMGTARFAWGVVMLYPVLNRRRWLIGALAAGFVLGNLSQLLHGIGREFSIEWLTWPRKVGRNSGWWDPAVGGTLLVAALGLHLPAAVMGRGRERLIGAGLAVVTLVAIAATGTRGAWIGGAGLVGVAVLVGVVRLVRGDQEHRSAPKTPLIGGTIQARRRRALIALAAGAVMVVIAAGAAWLVAGDSIRARYEAGREEIRGAIERGEFNTDTGARIAMAGWAWEAFTEHPVRGVGVGGYRKYVEAKLRSRGIDPATRSLHDHAHNALLHAAATTGLVGVGLWGLLIGVGMVGLVRSIGPGRMGTYDAGPLFGMIGLLMMTPFDSFQVNAQTAAVMWLLLSMRAMVRPGLRAECK